jgi:hypothetical protein
MSLFLTVWILFLLPVSVFAQEPDLERTGSISVTLLAREGRIPIPGVELSLYHVASVSRNSENKLSYTITDAFEACGCSLEDPGLSGTLDAFVKGQNCSVQALVTDASGTVMFRDLPLGLYFVKQTSTAAGYAPCTSFLVAVPDEHEGGYVYNITATPKTDVAKLTDITVRKVWNTDASAGATDHVTVQLLRDGVVVETATLSEQNQWQITYANMPESDAYSIKEVNIPKGFTATYSQSGYVFTVTNSAALIQTGQIVWPIPVLALAGLCLIAVGAVELRKTRNTHA